VVEITKLDKEEIQKLLEFEKKNDEHILTYDSIINDLKNENYTYLLAKLDKKIVGYISFLHVDIELTITGIVVDKKYRNKGIATLLYEYVEKQNSDIKNIFLEVRESNNTAISFYEKLNFKKIDIRKNYYKNPIENAIIYTKKIFSKI